MNARCRKVISKPVGRNYEMKGLLSGDKTSHLNMVRTPVSTLCEAHSQILQLLYSRRHIEISVHPWNITNTNSTTQDWIAQWLECPTG